MIKKMRLESGVELIPTNVEGGGGTDLTRDGELATDSSDNELKVRLDGATRTVVTEDQAQTITNKIIDADNNTISEIEVDNLKSGVLNTSTTLTGATDSQVPSALAVKTYINSAQTDLSNHINNPTDAHDASAISVIPTGNLISTDTQSALVELQGDIDSLGASRVVGPVSATDNAIARFDSTTGKLIQDSVVTVSDTGVVTGSSIDADTNVITNIKDADIKSGAAIDAAKIANGTVSNAEFQALDGVTSSIQTQINSKVNTTGGSLITPARVDMKQDSLANLTSYALTATNGQLVFATDSKETFVVKDGELSAVGGGGAGGINYISNPNADTNTNGWVRYKNTPGTAPIDGDGGSPSATYTFTRSTSAPLRGAASFLLTKPAALNAQGEGFSHYFYLDNADKGKVLNCSFDYQIVSGTYADDDMTVWIYDVLNDRLIQPAPFKIKNSGIVEKFSFEFQSNLISGGHTLIIHRSSPALAACTIKFDNFKVGPNEKSYGSPITDAVAKTFTLTNAGNATVTGTVAKIGENAVFNGVIKLGSTIPSGGYITLNLPSGYSVAPSVFYDSTINLTGPTSNILGKAFALAANSFGFFGPTGVGTGWEGPSVPTILTEGDNIFFTITAKQAGWSSSTLMSSDASTSVEASSAHKNSVDQTGINPNNSNVKITFPSIASSGGGFDTNGAWDTVNSKYIVKTPGKFRVSPRVFILPTNVLNNPYYLLVLKSGVTAKTVDQQIPTAGTELALQGSVTVDVAAGDYIEIAIHANGNHSVNMLTVYGAPVHTFVNIEKIQGPSQIMASSIVSFSANTSTTAATTSTPFIYTSKDHDTHNAYSTVTGKFKAPMSGNYFFTATAFTGTTLTTPTIYKNDIVIQAGTPTTISSYVGTVNIVTSLLTGDVIEIRPSINATASGVNNFSGFRIGGVV